jgi:hypothetical protein
MAAPLHHSKPHKTIPAFSIALPALLHQSGGLSHTASSATKHPPSQRLTDQERDLSHHSAALAAMALRTRRTSMLLLMFVFGSCCFQVRGLAAQSLLRLSLL